MSAAILRHIYISNEWTISNLDYMYLLLPRHVSIQKDSRVHWNNESSIEKDQMATYRTRFLKT